VCTSLFVVVWPKSAVTMRVQTLLSMGSSRGWVVAAGQPVCRRRVPSRCCAAPIVLSWSCPAWRHWPALAACGLAPTITACTTLEWLAVVPISSTCHGTKPCEPRVRTTAVPRAGTSWGYGCRCLAIVALTPPSNPPIASSLRGMCHSPPCQRCLTPVTVVMAMSLCLALLPTSWH
jgi:hypothetical protein